MRYFFDTLIGGLRYEDEDGEEFDTPEMALRAAQKIAGELTAEYERAGRPLVSGDGLIVIGEQAEEVGRALFGPPPH
jgi:hypothetical protein